MSIEVGQEAKLVQPAIQGPVTDARYNKDAKQLEYLLQFTDAQGDQHERWFLESQLAPVAATAPAATTGAA